MYILSLGFIHNCSEFCDIINVADQVEIFGWKYPSNSEDT